MWKLQREVDQESGVELGTVGVEGKESTRTENYIWEESGLPLQKKYGKVRSRVEG